MKVLDCPCFICFDTRGGHWGPLETAKKIIQNRKTEKKIDQNRKPHTKMSKSITFHIPVIKTDRSDTVVISGAYRVNYINFMTGFMNAMDLVFVSSSIFLN